MLVLCLANGLSVCREENEDESHSGLNTATWVWQISHVAYLESQIRRWTAVRVAGMTIYTYRQNPFLNLAEELFLQRKLVYLLFTIQRISTG